MPWGTTSMDMVMLGLVKGLKVNHTGGVYHMHASHSGRGEARAAAVGHQAAPLSQSHSCHRAVLREELHRSVHAALAGPACQLHCLVLQKCDKNLTSLGISGWVELMFDEICTGQ